MSTRERRRKAGNRTRQARAKQSQNRQGNAAAKGKATAAPRSPIATPARPEQKIIEPAKPNAEHGAKEARTNPGTASDGVRSNVQEAQRAETPQITLDEIVNGCPKKNVGDEKQERTGFSKLKEKVQNLQPKAKQAETLSRPAMVYDEYRRYLRRRGWEYQRRIVVWVVLPLLAFIAIYAIGVTVKPDPFTAENNLGDIRTLALSNYVLEGMPKDIEGTIQMDRQNFVILSEKPLCTMQELTGAFTGETVSYYPAKISPNTTSSYIISLGIPEFLDISLEKIEKDGAFVIAQTADFTTNTYLTDAYGSSANTRNKLIVVEKQKSHAFGDALSSLLKWFAVFGLLAYFVLLKLGVTENRRRSLY